jgi:hypothetical protein
MVKAMRQNRRTTSLLSGEEQIMANQRRIAMEAIGNATR